jgi:DNA-binding MarR family transcriptional regulator
MIDDYPDKNITKLAEHQGVIKGAISQLIRKLEAKGIFVRKELITRKNVCLELTDKGKEWLIDIKNRNDRQKHNFLELLDKFDTQDLEIYCSFFDDISKVLIKES